MTIINFILTGFERIITTNISSFGVCILQLATKRRKEIIRKCWIPIKCENKVIWQIYYLKIYTHIYWHKMRLKMHFWELKGLCEIFGSFKSQKVILWNLRSNCNFGKSGLKDNFAKVINQNDNFEKIWGWFVIFEKLSLWTCWVGLAEVET